MLLKIQNTIQNYAHWYLQRFGCSRKRLEENIEKKLQKKYEDDVLQKHKQDIKTYLMAFLDELESYGYLNDFSYGHSLAKGYLRKGYAYQKILLTLKSKSIRNETIHNIMESLKNDEEDFDDKAAQNYAKRRKIGPYRSSPYENKDQQDKDLQRMMRAGFSYQHSKKTVS